MALSPLSVDHAFAMLFMAFRLHFLGELEPSALKNEEKMTKIH